MSAVNDLQLNNTLLYHWIARNIIAQKYESEYPRDIIPTLLLQKYKDNTNFKIYYYSQVSMEAILWNHNFIPDLR